MIYIRIHYSNGRVLVRQVRAANKRAPKKTLFDSKAGAQRRVAGCSTSSDRLFDFESEHPATEALDGQQHCPKLDSGHCRLLPDFCKYSNREIQIITQPEEWLFIPGKLNPVDLAIHSSLEEPLIPSIRLDGLSFLHQSEDHWPSDLSGWR